MVLYILSVFALAAQAPAADVTPLRLPFTHQESAWIFQGTGAYDETHNPRYLDSARRVVHDALGRIDGQRGTYPEFHGNISYKGNVPWMCAQLSESLYKYYRQSGDVDAAIAIVGLADSILAENRTRDVPGDVWGYSSDPHLGKSGLSTYILIAPTVFYAYELTGDAYYLAHARAMYKLMIQNKELNSFRECYWLAPTLLYYLQQDGLEDARDGK